MVLSVAEANSAGNGGSAIMAPRDAWPAASSSQLLITPLLLPYICAHPVGTEECPAILPPKCPEAAGPGVCPGAATVWTHLHVPLLPHHRNEVGAALWGTLLGTVWSLGTLPWGWGKRHMVENPSDSQPSDPSVLG